MVTIQYKQFNLYPHPYEAPKHWENLDSKDSDLFKAMQQVIDKLGLEPGSPDFQFNVLHYRIAGSPETLDPLYQRVSPTMPPLLGLFAEDHRRF